MLTWLWIKVSQAVAMLVSVSFEIYGDQNEQAGQCATRWYWETSSKVVDHLSYMEWTKTAFQETTCAFALPVDKWKATSCLPRILPLVLQVVRRGPSGRRTRDTTWF